jgi:hypothetical protein
LKKKLFNAFEFTFCGIVVIFNSQRGIGPVANSTQLARCHRPEKTIGWIAFNISAFALVSIFGIPLMGIMASGAGNISRGSRLPGFSMK